MTLDKTTLDAIELADTDTLVRSVDGICARRDWDDLAALRLHLTAAVERGRQLWGVDEHCRYRFALEAPPEIAVPVVEEGPARFTLGPLTEVLSQANTWDDLADHLRAPSERAIVAHERALRGDDVGDEPDPVFGIPHLCDWEPTYPVATYRSDRAEFPTPDAPTLAPVELPQRGTPIDDDETEEALFALVTPWTSMSNGVTDLAIVEGGALSAVAALGVRRVTAVQVRAGTVLPWLVWTAASGGAHGRRRGAAAGRFHAWSAVGALAGLDWPISGDGCRQAAEELEWWMWDDGSTSGWSLRIAVADPVDGMAWAFAANDATEDE